MADDASSESSPAAISGTIGVVGALGGASVDVIFCNFGDDLNVGVDAGVGVDGSTCDFI